MRISILPKTSSGKWSVGLAIANILFFVLADVLTGFNPPDRFNIIILAIISIGISGAALVTGLISMIKRKERSGLAFVSTALGLWFLIGNVGSLFI